MGKSKRKFRCGLEKSVSPFSVEKKSLSAQYTVSLIIGRVLSDFVPLL